MSTSVKKLLFVSVDENRLKAYVRAAMSGGSGSIDAQMLIDELREAHVAVDERVKVRINEFVKNLAARKEKSEKFLIAEALFPVEAKPGEFQWADSSLSTSASDDSIDTRIKTSAMLVKQDAVIGKVIPPTDGKPGMNVLGETLPPKITKQPPIQLADSVRLSDDGASVLANRPGRVVFCDGQIAVADGLGVDQDIKPGTETTDWNCDVVIRGIVGESAKLATTSSIVITEAVEAAEIAAGEDVIVHYGLIGQGKSNVDANRDVIAKYCEDADIKAGRDVLIDTNVVNSRIKAGRRVLAVKAPVIGGEIEAGHCVEARALGSEGSVPTAISVGSPNPEAGTGKSLGGTNEGPYIKVHERIFERVQIRIEDRTTTITKEMKGPLRLEKQKIRMATELVAVTDGGNVQVLKSQRIDQ
ncbi:MAG: FapA family protein [Phycisphaerales bacterium]|nr:FapA family protein [Phycisphaerales bacterium]